MEKIIALIFGAVALALSIASTVHHATVESITAVAFAAAIVVTMVVLIIRDRKHTVTLTEDAPVKGKRGIDKVMKLSNELAPFVKEKDGKISITVKK